MRNLITTLTLCLFAVPAFSQYGNPGKISAYLNGECEIVVVVTKAPSPTSTLLECEYEISYYQPGQGYKRIILDYVPCDADTMAFDLPSLPNNVTEIRLVKRVTWQPTQGTQERISAQVLLPAHCTPAPAVQPPVAPPMQAPTAWQDGNTATPNGPASAHVSATDAGIWVAYDMNGFVLGNGPITPGETDITIPPSNSIIYLACYFFHNGEMQVETLTFL